MVTSTGDGVWSSVVGSLTVSDDVIINHAVTLDGIVNMTGDLTINASKTLNTTATDYNLTVSGHVLVTGTLTCNDSTLALGSLRVTGTLYAPTVAVTVNGSEGGRAVYVDGTVHTSTNLDLIITYNGSTNVLTSTEARDITLNHSGLTLEWEGNHTFRNITVTDCVKFVPETGITDTLTATGDVVITDGIIGVATWTGAASFDSLTIASSGTYIATSGTTTITGGGANGDANQALYGEGTFTHNNGTLTFNASKKRIPKGGTFYNVTVNGEIDSDGLYVYASTLLPQGIMPDGTTGASYVSILGTLQINNDEFRPYGADKVYVHNLIIGDGTGSANTAKFDFSNADAFDGTVFVDNVTINSDGQLMFGDGDETSATVGSSALNIYGSFRNLGGSVSIE